MATDTGPAPSLEAGAELERTLHNLHETRETWFRLVDPDCQDPTCEGS